MKPTTDRDAAVARFLDGLPSRELTVDLNRGLERRLQRALDSLARDDETVDPTLDSELALTLLAMADRGAGDGEADERVWATMDGWCHPLPRWRRAPLGLRARFAWRAAVTSWRAT